ncbi:SGNH/GDSL hydrolase family protein [Clostridium sp. MCC353]|uniref:SGNH/GDSL hydrolase family protein n=1 Tax=Clostridium sp. MCC353 TaxID=2592646 RepID=UPI001C029AA0|nr:SGNH/GDSL hydrolase family protein [Clostridium sp. MCC353]MBT9776726.1 SGNH/GDSL hydrolase family protein [Clostridium sp. MCC353]
MTDRWNKILIFGDSISTANHGDGGYMELLKASMGAERIENRAKSSSGLALTTPHSLACLLMQDEPFVEEEKMLILIWHGSNDWYWGTPMGCHGNEAGYTFWGALDYVLKCLRKRYPQADIIWLTPLERVQRPYGMENVEDRAGDNILGLTLEDYAGALKEAGKRYGFPVIDMKQEAERAGMDIESHFEDKIHPNGAGYVMINRIISEEIGKIYGV